MPVTTSSAIREGCRGGMPQMRPSDPEWHLIGQMEGLAASTRVGFQGRCLKFVELLTGGTILLHQFGNRFVGALLGTIEPVSSAFVGTGSRTSSEEIREWRFPSRLATRL